MIRLLMCVLALGFLAPVSYSEVVYDEFDVGDSSSDPDNPTDIGDMEIGDNTVIGFIDNFNIFPQDRDVYTFNIPVGQQLDSVILDEIDGDLHFFGFDDGPTADQAAADLVTAVLISSGNGGDNLISNTTMFELDFKGPGGSGVSGPLGAGRYTMWFQENDIDVFHPYTVTINTSAAAIPEPSSFAAIAIAGTAMVFYRRRKSKTDRPTK